MFCIECGQRMADEAKFCAYCGTRRAVAPPTGDVQGTQPPSAKPAAQPVPAPPLGVRAIRSTAEIMPVGMRKFTPIPPATAQRIQAEPVAPAEAVEPGTPEQNRLAHEIEPGEEPELIDTSSQWQTSAPVPSDAYSQGALYRDERPVNHGATAEASPPQAPAAAKPEAVSYTAVPFAAPEFAHDLAPAKRRISPVLIGAVLVALIALAGIVWMLRSSLSAGGTSASKVEITIFPTTAKVVAGKGIDFAATVTGAPTSEVTWKVEEGDDTGQIQTRGAYAKEGAISLYATYTPKTPGTYHLVATSTADPSKSASAEVTVVAK